MLKVGITGGIGSGKTTVCHIFETLGIPVYYADERAKELMVKNPDLVAAIKMLFSPEAYFLDGQLNRKYIAAIAFQNPDKLARLNALVHPAVQRDSQIWHESQEGVPYTIKEAALLFESGSFEFLDRIITVTAPAELRIQRVMDRDKVSRAEVEARIARQMPEEEKAKKSDFVIHNDGSKPLIDQVLAIHQALLKETKAAGNSPKKS